MGKGGGGEVERGCHINQNSNDPPIYLRVRKLGVSQDGASRLNGFDDFIGSVAGERETRSFRIYFHRSPHGLLGAVRHRIGLV